MADGVLVCAIVLGGLGFAFGVVYPLCALIFYPAYRRFGGTKTLREYMSNL